MLSTSSSVRRTVSLFCATLVALVCTSVLASPASAAEGFRYGATPVTDGSAPRADLDAPVAFALPAAAEPTEAAAAGTDPENAPAEIETEEDGFPWSVVVIGLIAAAVAIGTVIIGRRSRAS